MRSCTAKMTFVDVTALDDSAVTLKYNQEFCNPALFKEMVPQKDYATLEFNQFVLDGTKEIFPNNPRGITFWSEEKSDWECAFENASSAIVTFKDPHSSAGITLYFGDRYPASVKITWFSMEGSVLDSKIFYPESSMCTCVNLVQNYGELKIEILQTTFPDCYARMNYIMYGIELFWNEDVIKTAKVTEQCDVTGATLPENTATIEIIDENNDFDIENTNGSWRVVQDSQEVVLKTTINGIEHSAGTFYIDNFSFQKNVAKFNLKNSIAILDKQTFYDGEMYTNKKAGEILEEIFAVANFEKFEIEEDVYNTEISGYLGVKSCRECVKEICFACGAIASDSKSDTLKIFYPDRYVKHIVGPDRKVIGETSVSLEKYVSGVSIECSRYSLSSNTIEIYNDVLSKGTTRITFNMPYDKNSIVVSGGSVIKTSINYVDIFMEKDGVCTVTGNPYEETSFTYKKDVEVLPSGTKENVKKFGKCTVYSASKLPEIAKRLFDYYSLQKVLKMKFFAENECAGEWLNVSNVGGTSSYTLLENHSMDLTCGLLSTATCRGYNKVVTPTYFTGGELYAGERGII